MEKNYEDIFKEIIEHGAKMGEWSVLINHFTTQPNVIGYTNEIHGYKVYRNDKHGMQLDWDFKSKSKALKKFREIVRFEFEHCVAVEKARLRRLAEEAEAAERLMAEKEAADSQSKKAVVEKVDTNKKVKKNIFFRPIGLKERVEEHEDDIRHVRSEVGELVGWSLGRLNVEVHGTK